MSSLYLFRKFVTNGKLPNKTCYIYAHCIKDKFITDPESLNPISKPYPLTTVR